MVSLKGLKLQKNDILNKSSKNPNQVFEIIPKTPAIEISFKKHGKLIPIDEEFPKEYSLLFLKQYGFQFS